MTQLYPIVDAAAVSLTVTSWHVAAVLSVCDCWLGVLHCGCKLTAVAMTG